MATKSKPIYNKLIISAVILLVILLLQPLEVYFFIKDIAVLLPAGEIALKQRNLLLFIQAVMLIFIIPVYIFTFAFSWWYRSENEKSTYDPHLVDHPMAELAWWGLPLLFTVIIAIITYIKTHELDPYRPIASEKKALTIEVVALQWQWLFLYPEEKIATVNTLTLPTDRPLHFKITADAPMNSFWIPSLGGMIYAMPGMETQLFLIADKEGTYRGSSANISGKGFAGMTFTTNAVGDEEYKKWVEKAKQSEKSLDRASYDLLAKPTENGPPQTFALKEEKLFRQIIDKFMLPPTSEVPH